MAKMGRPKAENPADKRITIRLNGEEHELLLEESIIVKLMAGIHIFILIH